MTIKLLKEGMEIEARHVRRKQLNQYFSGDFMKKEKKASETAYNINSGSSTKKRLSTEAAASAQKKRKQSDSVRVL